MSESSPRVSVVIPHYNMHSHLPDAIQSVAHQDYENIELIVVDDGSDQQIVPGNYSSYDVPISFLSLAWGGKPKAVNRGFEKTTGHYITILDADDQLLSRSISRRVAAIQQENADLCLGSFEVSYRSERQSVRSVTTYLGSSNRKLICDLLTNVVSPIHQNAMLFSRKLLENTGGMDTKMLRGQDKDFAIRLLQQSQKMVYVQESVYRYNRYHRPINMRIKNRLIGTKYKLQVIGRHAKKSQKIALLIWGIVVAFGKLVYDLFGIYKK